MTDRDRHAIQQTLILLIDCDSELLEEVGRIYRTPRIEGQSERAYRQRLVKAVIRRWMPIEPLAASNELQAAVERWSRPPISTSL